MIEEFKNYKIGICCHSHGNIDFDLHGNHIGIFSLWGKEYKTVYIGVAGMKNAQARDALISKALEEDCTHVIFIDTDHEIEDNLLPVLLSHKGAAMVSGLVCKRAFPYPQVGFVKGEDTYYYPVELPLDDKAYKVDVCAFGCTLIDLNWLTKLEKPYFRDEFTADKEDKYYNKRSDVIICERLKEIGGEIIIDTRSQVGHQLKPHFVRPDNRHLFEQIEVLLQSPEIEKTEHQVPVYKVARSLADDEKALRIIDLGCRDGLKLKTFLTPYTSCVLGVDQDERSLLKAESFMPKATWLCGDLQKPLPFKILETDLIICADVLEHLEHPELLLKQIPKNTTCIFSTPDASTLGALVRENTEHKKNWTKNEFVELLTENNFVIVETLLYDEISDYQGIIVTCRKE